MKKLMVFVLLFVLMTGVFFSSGFIAESKCECVVNGPEKVYQNEKITLTFFFNCVNADGFQGSLKYDKSLLVLENFTQDISDNWTIESAETASGANFILYGKKNDVLFGKRRALTAVFNVKANAGSAVKVALENMKTTEGDNSYPVASVEYTATVLSLPTPDVVGLSLLSVTGHKLTPEFSSSQYSYNITVSYLIDKLQISAKATSNNATINIEDVSLVENAVTPVKITVTENNVPVVYTIYAFREPNRDRPLSSNIMVMELQLSDGYVEPEFSDDISFYTVTLQNNINEFYVKPTLADPNAYYTVDGDGEMKVGENIVKITVTPEDLSVQRVFTLTVTRLDEKVEVTPSQDEPDSGVFQPWLYVVVILASVIVIILFVVMLSIGTSRKKNKK